jgi:curved DNA-binding protein CbpA
MRTHYDNLKVPETATRDAIKSAYRRLCLKHHPDRNPGNPDCERIMRIINDAYGILSDPAKRRDYDLELALRRARGFQSKDPANSSSSREAWNRRHEARAHATAGGRYYRSRPDSQAPYQSPMWAHRAPPKGPSRAKMHFTMGMSMLIVIMVMANLYHKGGDLPFSIKGLGQHVKEERVTVFPGAAGSSQDRKYKDRSPLLAGLFANGNPARPKQSSYVRPDTAPNGAAWPMIANYVQGYPQEATAGESRVTLDSTESSDDVFVKLIALKGGRAWQVRTCFLPASSAFTLMKLSPGDYELRYQNLATGEVRATDIFRLQETRGPLGIKYTTMRLMLFKADGADVNSREISQGEF